MRRLDQRAIPPVLLLCLLLSFILFGGMTLAAFTASATDHVSPSTAGAPQPIDESSNDSNDDSTDGAIDNFAERVAQADAGAPLYANVVLQLDAPTVIDVYLAATAAQSIPGDDAAQAAAADAVTALAQAHLAEVEFAQQQVVAALGEHDAQLLYRTQRVYNGVAVRAPTDQLAALAALPNVQAVYPLIPKTPTNAKVAALLDTPALWQGIDRRGLTGQGITIAIIDTGIDYLHTMFGGPGRGYGDNDSTLVGDVPNFPSAKVIGGYDFTGDNYDASPGSFFYQPIPQPDPDPTDCYAFGHGTHVSGIAAGYGVQAADGATYRGAYDTTLDFGALRLAPGVAPLAQLYALKVFGCSGSSDIVDAAIEWAVDPNQDGDFRDHADVINLSLGSSFGAPYDSTVIAVDQAAQLGIIVVTSAGNTGDVHYAVGSPGLADRAIAVAATSVTLGADSTVRDGAPANFSSRGPSRGGATLKPDLAAPGVNIFSAQRGTGTLGTARSGTSMASPVVAGVMALLRQAYPADGSPGWSVADLKALVMNTAHFPVTDVAVTDVPVADGEWGTPIYSLLRTGAGRIDPGAALQSRLIAYDAEAPARVSVSFGLVDVAGTVTQIRNVRVANKALFPVSVRIDYRATRTLPGATVDVDAGQVLTLAAGAFATLPITLTLDATQLARRPDPTRLVTPPDREPWLDEVSGLLILTPLGASSGVTQPPLHLPIHALPRAVSNVAVWGGPLDFGTAPNATHALTFTGDTLAGAVAPTQTVPLVGLFNLLHSSPPITVVPNGDPNLTRYRHADLRYVGVAGPVLVNDVPTLYFALVTYGAWATPHEVQFQIEIDTNGDSVVDYRLANRDSNDLFNFASSYTDEFVSVLEDAVQLRTIQGPLNLYAPTTFESRIFNSNMMVLPLQLPQLGNDLAALRFQVLAYSRDLEGAPQPLDRTPPLTWDVTLRQAIEVHPADLPLRPLRDGERIEIYFRRVRYIEQGSQGLLVLLPHNPPDARTLVLPAQYGWPYANFLPAVHKD